MRLRRAPAVVAVLAAALATATSARATGTGAISGHVSGGADPVCVLALNSAGDAVASTATDSAGNYTLTGIPAGAWTVEFYPDDGCVGLSTAYAFQFYRGAATPASATPVAVSAGQTTTGINATLQPGSTIRGTVTDTSGFPLGAVCAILEDTAGRPVVRQPTDAQGNYVLSQLPAGSYVVQFVDDDCAGERASYASTYYPDAPTLATAQVITIAAGITYDRVDAALVALPHSTRRGGGGGTSGGGGGPATGPGAGAHHNCSVALLAATGGRWTVDRHHRLHLRVSARANHCVARVIVRRARIVHGRFTAGRLVGRRRLVLRPRRPISVTIALHRIRSGRLWIVIRPDTGPPLVRTVIPVRWA